MEGDGHNGGMAEENICSLSAQKHSWAKMIGEARRHRRVVVFYSWIRRRCTCADSQDKDGCTPRGRPTGDGLTVINDFVATPRSLQTNSVHGGRALPQHTRTTLATVRARPNIRSPLARPALVAPLSHALRTFSLVDIGD
uniref:Uncharacterized protein n=1 Tax=Plectus sambesii TaxID=2011161 RepID=A0A914UT15_9BILA